MIYNKYMTEHLEPNKYFYLRRGIIQKITILKSRRLFKNFMIWILQ